MLQDRGLTSQANSFEGRPRRFPYSPDLVPGVTYAAELLIIGLVGFVLWSLPAFHHPEYNAQHAFAIIFVMASYAHLTTWAALGHINAIMRPIRQADNVAVSIVTSFLFLLTVIYGLDVAFMFDSRWILSFLLAALVGVLGLRVGAFALLRVLSRRRVIGRNLVVLGTGAQSARFLRKIQRDPPYFTEVLGVFAVDADSASGEWEGFPILGDIDDLLRYARNELVDDIVVAMPWNADRTVIETVEKLKELPVNVYLGSDLVGFDLAFRPVLGSFSQLPLFEVVQRPISGWSAAAKKALDFLLAGIGLILLSPLLLLVAIAVKIDSPGPVFFMQKRLGFNNRPFSIYKFRSMYHNNGAERVVQQATKGDPRVTRVGRFIRATSIDELPQLLNVFDGTMSLVGPRPHALSHNEEYGAQIRGYFARHKVKPGITGWAQVNGFRGETADLELMRRRVECDVYYTENWSLLFDIKILVMTVLVVLFQRTAY